jgi:VWFA-related protein
MKNAAAILACRASSAVRFCLGADRHIHDRRRGEVKKLVCFAVIAAGALPGFGSAEQRFKTATELVTVPVTVNTNEGTAFVPDLKASDFRVFEDDVEQTIAVFDRERRPLSLCIAFDSSHSMAGSKQRLAALALQTVLTGLHSDDEVSLVVFTTHVEMAMTWTPARDVPSIDWAKWKPIGMTALVDAVRACLELVTAARNPRPVILIVSDGEDMGSVTPLLRIAATRRQSETLVYAIRTEQGSAPESLTSDGGRGSGPRPRQPPFNILPMVVGDSGGTVFTARVEPEAALAGRSFIGEVGAQYMLGYVSSNAADGTYRRLKVEPRDPSVNVRHRAGYLAVPR